MADICQRSSSSLAIDRCFEGGYLSFDEVLEGMLQTEACRLPTSPCHRVTQPATLLRHLQLLPIPSSGMPSAPATRTAGVAGGQVGPEPSLAGMFRTPEMPMLGVALFSPNTQVRANARRCIFAGPACSIAAALP